MAFFMSGMTTRSLRSILASDRDSGLLRLKPLGRTGFGTSPLTYPLWVSIVLILNVPAISQGRRDAREVFSQAISDFEAGRIEESVEGFDDLTRLSPNLAPQLWQRGIALYYAGRYEDCREQFDLHRTVNPNDVENAAWHFLCVARAESPVAARSALLPVGPDRRVPMSEIYEMFRGNLDATDVLRAGDDGLQAQFYAYLYAGLYFEAMGDSARALTHIRTAAQDRYRGGGYMHSVARVHLGLLEGRQ